MRALRVVCRGLTNGKLGKGMAAIVHIHATEGVHADLIQFKGIFRLSLKAQTPGSGV